MSVVTNYAGVPGEVEALWQMISESSYPCLGAKSAYANDQIHWMLLEDIRSSGEDLRILRFLYDFIDTFRTAGALSSAVIIFDRPDTLSEEEFDLYLWQRLQALADLDSATCAYDARVSNDPEAPSFNFSLKEEALYVIGLHPGSSRRARRFSRPALVFNPHQQFESLRVSGKYDSMKRAIRRREVAYSGSLNPMLDDFGTVSEAKQYSGKRYDNDWKCPFISRHRQTHDHSSQERSSDTPQ